MTFPCCPADVPGAEHASRFAVDIERGGLRPLPAAEPEWDSADSGAFQDRVEAGEIDQYGEPRQPGHDEWGHRQPCRDGDHYGQCRDVTAPFFPAAEPEAGS